MFFSRQTFLAVVALGAAVCSSALIPVQAQTYSNISISGLTSIYGANTAGNVSGDNSGIRPTAFALAAGTGRILTFSSVTGTTTANGGTPFGPDGGTFTDNAVDIVAFNGISGIYDNTTAPRAQMALIGFFGNGTFSGTGAGATAPARLDFTNNHGFANLTPLLNQTFFVGDGLTGTGTGTVQQFVVPDSATVLYLGFADGFFSSGTAFVGQPGSYNDNTGSLTASFNVSGAAAAPEPVSLALLAGGLVFPLGVVLRRRAR